MVAVPPCTYALDRDYDWNYSMGARAVVVGSGALFQPSLAQRVKAYLAARVLLSLDGR